MGIEEDIKNVSEELQIKIISWFLVKEGCEPVTVLTRVATVFSGKSLDPSLVLELLESETLNIKDENTDPDENDLDADDVVDEDIYDIEGDNDVTDLDVQSNNKVKSREKATCQFCQKVLVNKYRLNSHILKFHQQNQIQCQFCSKVFALPDLYRKHLRLTHNKQKQSSICDENNIDSVQSRLYDCKSCKKQFKSKSLLAKHELSHKKLTCSFCDQIFKGRRQLKSHLETHGFVCVTCCEVFTDQSSCNLHRLQEHCQKPLKCDKCVSSFTSRISLFKHQKDFHAEDEAELDAPAAYVNDPTHEVKIMLVCDKCNKVFDRKSGLVKHQLTCDRRNVNGNENEKGFQCNVCQKMFQNKYDMKVHTERHSSTPKYPCSFEGCSKKFFTKTDMKRHVKVSHEKQFAGSCEICGRKFLTVDGVEWRQHMDSHNQKKSLMCPFCPKSFSSDNCLKSHMVSHLDTRAWSCSLCPKTFKRLKNVKYHVKTFHNIKNEEELKCCCVKQQSEPTKAEIQLIIHKRKEELNKLHSSQTKHISETEQDIQLSEHIADDPPCISEAPLVVDVVGMSRNESANHVSVIQPNHTLHFII